MYCNLHNHTTRGSLLDSIIKTEDLVKFAKTNNQKAVAVTDHGSCAELIALGKYCRQYGVKPIYGCEVYEVDNMWNTDFTKDNPEIRNHLILFAKNQTGYQNLLKLSSLAGTKGRYFKPRIDLDEIKKHDWGRGIIASTACLAGRVGRWCVSDIPKDKIMTNINNYVDKLSLVFDDVYLEFQAHNTPDQTKMNKVLCWYLDKHFDKWHDHFIITSDAHMVNESDRELHRVFVATGQAREVGETYKDCYLMTDNDVRKTTKLNDTYVDQAFKNIDSLIDSISDNIDVGLDNPEQMPTFKTPDQYKDNEQYLKALIKQGYKEKRHLFKGKEQIYQDRIKMEFPVIKELGYINYFIVMYLLVNEIRKNNIPLGYARGSAGGCLILYLIGVTQVDSIKWDLDFSRFANIGRKGSPADVDTDVSRRKRQQVIQIIKDLFGKDKVCPLATYNTMTLKVAIRDVGKVLSEPEGSLYQGKIPYSLRDLVAKIVPEDCNDYKQLISTKGIDLYYEQFPKWFEYSFKLAGLPKSRGKHASAIIVTPKPITDYMSLCLDKDKQPLIENEMHNAMDDIGCVKIDLLGLKTLDIIDDTLKFAHLTWNDVDINTLNFQDKKVFNDIYKKGNCVGIFQMESVEAESMLRKVKADNVEDIVAVNASNRPGTKDEFPDYIKNKLHPEQIKVIHPDLIEIFKQSHSILLYQEQTLALFRYAGFPEDEVDIARRAIGKKLPDVMKSLEQKFRQGLKAKDWTDDQIKSMWDLIVKQSSYSFNRSHAVAYALLSYLTAYLKEYYPVEFITSCLISSDNKEQINKFILEAKRLGIKYSSPSINKSNETFTPDVKHKAILYGLKSINNFKDGAYNIVIQNRPYKSLKDYFTKTIDIDKTSQIMLIKSGALNELTNKDKFIQTKYLFHYRFINGKETKKPLKAINKKHIEKLFDAGIITKSQTKDKDLCLKLFNKYRKRQQWKSFKDKYLGVDRMTKYINLQFEMESLNTYISGSPFDNVVLPNWKNTVVNNFGNVAGTISQIKVNKIKKGKNAGSKMAFLNIETPDGTIVDITVFADKYRKYRELIEFGKPIVVSGRKDNDRSYIAERIITLEQYVSDTYSIQRGLNENK